MGGTFQAIAELTPSYHYAGLGWSVVAGGGLALGDVLTVTALGDRAGRGGGLRSTAGHGPGMS